MVDAMPGAASVPRSSRLMMPALLGMALLFSSGIRQDVVVTEYIDLVAEDLAFRPRIVNLDHVVEDPTAFSFILLGDTGYGNDGQRRVADGIGKVCAELGCAFVVGLGDNIYNFGVDSPHDPQFIDKFEGPYTDLDLPFYMTLGNHDVGHNGNYANYNFSKAEHQIAYHYRNDRPSDLWHMPARFYTLISPVAQFYALDTWSLLFIGDPSRPEHATALDQVRWLADMRTISTAPWQFAFGHHHYITNGRLGDAGAETFTPRETQGWKSFVDVKLCGEVDFLFTGHDHTLQWLSPVEGCEDTQFIISGGGSEPRPLPNPDRHEAVFQAGDTLGFFWAHVDADSLEIRAFDGDGQQLFRDTVVKAE